MYKNPITGILRSVLYCGETVKVMSSKLIQFLTIFFVLAAFANVSLAQNLEYSETETDTFPWESQSDYAYFEEASHFWNLNFRPGTGIVSVNCFEYLEFQTQSNFLYFFSSKGTPPVVYSHSFVSMDNEVKDYWSGISFGGVVYKYFQVKIEGGMAQKTEYRSGIDEDETLLSQDLVYNWDLTFNAEIRFGLPINKDFTLVGMTSFRVFNTKIENYKVLNKLVDEYNNDNVISISETEVDIDTEVFIFRAQIQLYFEVFALEKNTSLNVFAGLGYHSYQAQEQEYGVKYYPERTLDADFILGATLILNNDWMFELKVIPTGVFSAYLQFSYIV